MPNGSAVLPLFPMPPLVAGKVNMIMCDASKIVKQRQLAIRRELDRRGITLKVVSMDSGVSYSSLASYFPAHPHSDPAQMPTGVLYALCGHVPDDLLSLMLPEGRVIVQVPEDLDHDELCEAMHDYIAEKHKAHHPESECGPAIGPNECKVLRGKFVRVGRAA